MRRYEDAGYYHWLLARTHLSEAQRQREEEQQGEEEGDLVSRFHWHIEQAELYHVYHSIHRYLVRESKGWVDGRGREGGKG